GGPPHASPSPPPTTSSYSTISDPVENSSFFRSLLEDLKSSGAKNYRDRFSVGLVPLLEKFKQASFYATYFADQGFVLPSRLASDNRAVVRVLIRFVRRRVKGFRPLHSTLAKSEAVVRRAKKLHSVLPEKFSSNIIEAIKKGVALG